ncbi:sporulation protein YqfD [Carboxydothermus pertinax]|uniref:Sporulation protein YqfD n=1 Tax=Carboxydothermus pertinax TaxID=870242 RepID=A0A1L8CT07_9THEO|nr:sporulation protein YqfD [Carboxydothermus pertinax]GAV22051.1 sporulation protein YqfD [Carboxydothermus pertinax]
MFRWFFGEIRFKLQGTDIERFLNLAFSRQIDLREVKYNKNGLTFKTTLKNFRKVKALGKQVGAKTQVISKEGLPFWGKKILKRPGIIAGLFLLLGIIYTLTGFIWFIDVKGFGQEKEKVYKILRDKGIKPWTEKRKIDEKYLQREIMAQMLNVSWVSIEKKGVWLIVSGKRQKGNIGQKYKKADIVAKRDGIIKEILVFRGSLRVRMGQKVTAGEVLISGVDEWGNAIVADGTIKAVTWYKKQVSVPLKEERLVPTGRESELIKLYFGRHEITIKKPKEKFSMAILVEKRYRLPGWRNIIIPIELYRVTYKQVKKNVNYLTLEEGAQKAYNLALEELKKEVDARLITYLEKSVSGMGDSVTVTVKAQAFENIGRLSGIQEE